jgi:hypothetical protein
LADGHHFMMRKFMIFTFSEATLTVRLHLWLMTRDIDQKGFSYLAID